MLTNNIFSIIPVKMYRFLVPKSFSFSKSKTGSKCFLESLLCGRTKNALMGGGGGGGGNECPGEALLECRLET
jgi:hypothetical protein